MMSRDEGSSWCTCGVCMYDGDKDVWRRTMERWRQGICRKHGGLIENTCGWVIGHEVVAWTLGSVRYCCNTDHL